jgi:hypothetical protein
MSRSETVQPRSSRCLEVSLAREGWLRIPPLPPPDDCRFIPFLRIVGSLQEWSEQRISDRDLSRSLRKAAWEVQNGDF